MRSSKPRSRGKNNRNRQHTGGGNITNRVFDSSGPEGKVRGTPQQIIDKYNQLVRDAQLANDRVAAENFAQHAEHYTRLVAENQREIDAKRETQEAQNRDRQAQRDQERAERLERQEAQQANAPAVENSEQPSAPSDAPQPFVQSDLGSSPQPDLLDDSQADSGLVETPEAKPRRQNRGPRKPRVENNAAEVSGDTPQGQKAETAEKPKRAPRPRRRKPVEAKTDAAPAVATPAPQAEPSGE